MGGPHINPCSDAWAQVLQLPQPPAPGVAGWRRGEGVDAPFSVSSLWGQASKSRQQIKEGVGTLWGQHLHGEGASTQALALPYPACLFGWLPLDALGTFRF